MKILIYSLIFRPSYTFSASYKSKVILGWQQEKFENTVLLCINVVACDKNPINASNFILLFWKLLGYGAGWNMMEVHAIGSNLTLNYSPGGSLYFVKMAHFRYLGFWFSISFCLLSLINITTVLAFNLIELTYSSLPSILSSRVCVVGNCTPLLTRSVVNKIASKFSDITFLPEFQLWGYQRIWPTKM